MLPVVILIAHLGVREGPMQASRPKVLILDDDPMHLEIYGLLMKQAGYDALPTLVQFVGTEIPRGEWIGLVLLDYRLNSTKTSSEFACEIRTLYPTIPIIVLSDVWSLPDDIAPFVNGFVRKGEPAKLLETVARFFVTPPDPGTDADGARQHSENL
jgi:DNA-binding response OmpR family regulator